MSSPLRVVTSVCALCLCLSSASDGSEELWLCRWRTPVPVTELNTSFHDKAPFLCFDGLTFVFSRDAVSGSDYSRIYEAKRSTISEPFDVAVEVRGLEWAGGHVSGPWVSRDNLRIYYYVTGTPGRRLKVARRDSADDPWFPGTDISELNDWGDVADPSLTPDERIIVFGGYGLSGGHGEWDLWMADRDDGDCAFGNVVNLHALNTSATEIHPSIAPDGLTLYFMSDRNGTSQIFRAHRDSLDVPFGAVEHIASLDTSRGRSEFPSISPDGESLYFGRWPDGRDMDIYVSRRGSVYLVDGAHGNDQWDGLSSRTAFRTIQQAVDVAGDGDVVAVYPGVYREEVHLSGKAIILRSVADAAVIEAPEGSAVSFIRGETADTVLQNFVIANSYVGILCSHSSPTIVNVTVSGNVMGAEAYGDSNPVLSNSIFWGNLRSDLCGCQATYSCIERGGSGERNFSEDPLFVDPAGGDYHVRSERGRYWPEHDLWVLDDVSSPCIDGGDPTAEFSSEPKPNGNRRNVGAHGGTPYAERSELPFTGDINGDGVFDATDYGLFMMLWQEQTGPASSPAVRRGSSEEAQGKGDDSDL
ncbi:MAG: hypothetical protein ACM3VT_10500 [Solirubrobacterales bacterium]